MEVDVGMYSWRKESAFFFKISFVPGVAFAALVSQAMFLCLLVVVSGRGGIA